MRRYVKVHKKNFFLISFILILIVLSSYTGGMVAKTLAVIAGIAMIYAGISLTIWIFRTPSRNDKDAVV